MLTLFTQVAIALLQDISSGAKEQSKKLSFPEEDRLSLLRKLETGRLIHRNESGKEGDLSSYQLCRSLEAISLLDILEALKEPIDCTLPTLDWLQTYYPVAIQKLGTLNYVIRQFCSEIKLAEW